jgi:hydroxyacylglutathione hydrolase
VIHTPGHSKDSVCFYCEKEKVLLSGDTPLRVTTMGGSYSVEFINALENISRRNISTIYPGHDAPIKQKVREMVRMTLANVKSSGLMGCF